MASRSDIVIGSGPAGVAVASALLARGRKVVMVDGGKSVDPSDPDLAERLQETSPDRWLPNDRAAWMAPQFQTPAGQVRRFGSDASMEGADAVFDTDAPGIGLRASLAKGGLSNLWGGAVAPYTAKDMAGWPISADEMKPHYQALRGILPIAGSAALATHPGPGPSRQAEAVLARAAARGLPEGVGLAPAQTAVADGCTECGLCLHGCPWGLIWSASHALHVLTQKQGFAYQSGAPVVALDEDGECVTVRHADGRVTEGERVYVAAGVLQTARLVFAAGLAKSLVLRDSQFAFLPMLHRWSVTPRPDALPRTTLPQLFVEISDRALSPFDIHGQIYSWNEFFEQDLLANYGTKLPSSAPLWRAIGRRLLVAQIFLHSDHGARITLRPSVGGRLAASVEPGQEFGRIMTQAQKRLGRAMGRLGVHALQFAARMAEPGASFHVGASLPMATDPRGGQSDVLGRPFGAERVHVVDASVLPAIAARTVTFSVMANAHRIGSIEI